ncbi:Ulp1 peptidase [Malassezia caprae]|uniref:Ulp1 peptidase n=1 Tax=Malassezia caprae TaxID=1381934 RepID=A0AAF0IXP2_9BASI|nr:Ulp1 peptidase [Malassezia caprae]
MGNESGHDHVAHVQDTELMKERAEKGREAKTMHDVDVDTFVHADVGTVRDCAHNDTVQVAGEALSREALDHGASEYQCDVQEKLGKDPDECPKGPADAHERDPQEFAKETWVSDEGPEKPNRGSCKDTERDPKEGFKEENTEEPEHESEGEPEGDLQGDPEREAEDGAPDDSEEDPHEDPEHEAEDEVEEDSEEEPEHESEGEPEEDLQDPEREAEDGAEEDSEHEAKGEPEEDSLEDPEDLEKDAEASKDDPEDDLEDTAEEEPDEGPNNFEEESEDLQDSDEDPEEDSEDLQDPEVSDEFAENPKEEFVDSDQDPETIHAAPSDGSEVIVIDDSDEAPSEPSQPAPRPAPTDALSRYLASRPFRPVYTTGALKAPAPEPIRPGRAKGAGPMPRRSLSSLSQRRKAPLAMAEFRAGLQARQQARIAAMVRDTFHTLRGARTRGTWEDFQALVHKRAHVQQLLDLETLRTHPRTPVLDEAEYTKRMLAALQAREAHARAQLPERPVPVEAQRQAVRTAKAQRRAMHGVLGRAVLPSALPASAEAQVQQALARRGVVASMTGAQVEAHDMAKLRPGQWLNDEVINFYGQLIQQRANQAAPQPGDASPCWAVHVFSSFFWQNLSTRGYAGVRRWSRHVDLFTKDLVLMPINLGQAHWVCAAIDLRLRRFAYYDSVGMRSPAVLQRLRAYLTDELKDKHGLALCLDDWEDYCAGDTSPQQSNGYDCGVFAAQTLEQLSRRDPAVPYPPALEAGSFVRRADPQALALLREEYAGEYAWNFGQRDMPYLRRRMVYEIATKQLLA